MSDPQSKADIIDQLTHIQQGIAQSVEAMSAAQFSTGTTEAWSAEGYLKHLILSVKPLAKGINLPPAQLEKMFGLSDGASRSYAEIVATYQARINDGMKAENYSPVVPVSYRMPEGITDEKEYLLQTWNDGNNRLLSAIEQWDEQSLDRYQLPHPAIGTITVREILFFTIHHNTLHWGDMRNAASAVTQNVQS